MSATTLGHKRTHVIGPALIGSFLLGGLALGVLAIVLFGGSRLFAPVARAVIFFQDSVYGLSVGAPVTFRGVQIGSVKSVAVVLDPAVRRARIPVYIELDPDQVSLVSREEGERGIDLPRLVEAGLRARLVMQSIVTGQLYVDLDFRPDMRAPSIGLIAGTPEIPAIPSELQQLQKQITGLPLRDLADQSSRTLRAIELLAGDLDHQVGSLAASVRDTSESVRATMDVARQAASALQADMSRAARDMDGFVNDGRRQLATSGGQLDRLLASADRLARDADTAAATLNRMIDLHAPERSDIDATLRDLAATAASLRSFATEIERNPSLILHGRSGQ